MKIIAVIPAHLSSLRLYRKVLIKFKGLEMIEHVRRRALISDTFDDVFVATGDELIEDLINSKGGKVIRTLKAHESGTSRVAEAIDNIDCDHIVLLQGDEPLMLPQHLKSMVQAIKNNPSRDAWNATADLENEYELDKQSFVKCSISEENKIIYCFRRSPSFTKIDFQLTYIKKILGLIAYKKDTLIELSLKEKSYIESIESIEQISILINNYSLYSVPMNPSLPSVNEPGDENQINKLFEENIEQQELLKKVLAL
tara:strand:- start:416 stop:1183 length:768 start_codon:yes stop_codon:yes gene_type:complete